ncbi:MAG: type II toxin-antitoxin system RelE/ParE family toxin [Ginsengibacter sp.]
MIYKIVISRTAQKQLAKINNPFFKALIDKIELLKTDPRPQGCKKLTGREGWRIRAADYRIIYEIKDDILQIIVIEIDHRKQVYR